MNDEWIRRRASRQAIDQLRLELAAGIDRQLGLLALPVAVSSVNPAGCSADRWWWCDEDGAVLLKVFFRGRALCVNGAADTALLSSTDEVAAVLTGVRKALFKGRLDSQLQADLQP